MSNKKCLLEFFPGKGLREWEGEGKEIKQGCTTRPSCTDTIQQQSSYLQLSHVGQESWSIELPVLHRCQSLVKDWDMETWIPVSAGRVSSLCQPEGSPLMKTQRYRPLGNKKHTHQELHTLRWTKDLKHDSIWVVGSGIVKVRGFENIIKALRQLTLI